MQHPRDVVVLLVVAQVLFVHAEQPGEFAAILTSQGKAPAHGSYLVFSRRNRFRLCTLADYEGGCLVIAQRDKLWVSQVIRVRPLDIFDATYQSRPKPTALAHVFGR